MTDNATSEAATPRVPPLPVEERSELQQKMLSKLGKNEDLNIFNTMVRAPEAMRAFLTWGSYILSDKNSLSARDRELAILGIGHLCSSNYEVFQHEAIGLACGLSEDEIQRLRSLPDTGSKDLTGWDAKDIAILTACQQLRSTSSLDDDIWAELRTHFNERECMDLVYTIGQYSLVSMLLNSFGVQIEND